MSANKPRSLLIDDLKSPDRETRLSAAWLLGQQHGEKAIPGLIAALNDQDKGVRYAAMVSLATIGSINAKKALTKELPAITEDLKTGDKETRKAAAELLQMIGTPEAMSILRENAIK